MSIMQDFEEARKIIGPEKYDAIEKYLDEVCPKSNYDKYNKELNSMLDYSTDEWLKQKKELEEKYGIIFLSDVIYKPEEWEKYEAWYNEKSKTYIIELWENNADRNDGFGQIKEDDIKDLGQAIKKLKKYLKQLNVYLLKYKDILTENHYILEIR